MDLLSRNDLQALITHQSDRCVSILMPMHRGADSRQDRIVLRNSIQKARDRLIELGTRTSEADEILAPASQLLNDADLWRSDGDLLAVYLAPGLSRIYRLPLDLPLQVSVDNHLVVRPLLPLFTGDGMYYVLAVSQNQVRLAQCTHRAVKEVSLALTEAPTSLADSLRFEERGKVMQYHTQAPPSAPDRGAALYYGHWGFDTSIHKEEIAHFLQQVDRGVRQVLQGQEAPLVVASVDFLFAMYRKVNTYPHLVDQAIEGNPDRMSLHDLREHGRELADPWMHREQEKAVAQFSRSLNAGFASDRVKDVVQAAFEGRVGVLFTSDKPQWGTFNPQTLEVTVHESRLNGDNDLCDFATLQTLLHGGLVYASQNSPRLRPTHHPLAAIYRY